MALVVLLFRVADEFILSTQVQAEFPGLDADSADMKVKYRLFKRPDHLRFDDTAGEKTLEGYADTHEKYGNKEIQDETMQQLFLDINSPGDQAIAVSSNSFNPLVIPFPSEDPTKLDMNMNAFRDSYALLSSKERIIKPYQEAYLRKMASMVTAYWEKQPTQPFYITVDHQIQITSKNWVQLRFDTEERKLDLYKYRSTDWKRVKSDAQTTRRTKGNWITKYACWQKCFANLVLLLCR